MNELFCRRGDVSIQADARRTHGKGGMRCGVIVGGRVYIDPTELCETNESMREPFNGLQQSMMMVFVV